MLLTENQATTATVIAPANRTSDGQVANEFACQYPSKKCRRIRATKRGGDLHRLCEFHRERANKNQWFVDQRRRLRRECHRQRHHNGTLAPMTPHPPIAEPATVEKPPQTMLLTARNAAFAPMQLAPRDDALDYLDALLFDDEDGFLFSDCTDDGYMTDATTEWAL